MNIKLAFPYLVFFVILGSAFSSYHLMGASAASQINGKALILYDAASRAIPGTPLMNYTDFPTGAAQPAFLKDATILDTSTAGREIYAGWTSNGTSTPGFPLLDPRIGYQVDFTLQVENESHGSNHRSGFNLIILGVDARGIELAFWENEIWAQSDRSTGRLFQHGEGVRFPTTTGLVEYHLTITGDIYILTANTQAILTGPLRDYSEFDGFPDPYQTPNFLFLGDNTTSAQARVRLRFLSATGTEPVTPMNTGSGASENSPLPTGTPTLLPSVSPIPSPAPAGKMIEFCPSGGLLFILIIANAMLLKPFRLYRLCREKYRKLGCIPLKTGEPPFITNSKKID